MAKDIIGEENFIEVFINASLEVCERRDPKGLYKKVRAGEIKNFTGIDSPFEAPHKPSIELETDKFSIDECAAKALNTILPIIEY